MYFKHSSKNICDLDHEALYEDVVCAGAAGDDVGEVGQLLDEDDAVVAAGLQHPRHKVGDNHRNQHRHTVRHLFNFFL